MAKKREIIIISAALIAIVILFAGLFMFQKFMNHESNQNERLDDIEARISLIDAKDNLAESPTDDILYGGGYNYLAIGNSITKHQLADYWWNECGMAATSANRDYYHIVVNHLKEEKDDVSSNVFNFSIWETLYTDRAETLEILDHYLDESLDLITIQLGENAQNLDTFESDFEYLINHIKNVSTAAEVIVVGNFWDNKNDEMKKKAAEKCGVKYISLNEIKDDKEYQCGIGTEVLGEDGETHTVDHAGVAAHPNDKAMEYIADKIIGALDGKA